MKCCKFSSPLLLTLVILTICSGCELDNLLENTQDSPEKILGKWSVEDVLVPKSATSKYNVEIILNDTDSSKVRLFNFHLLGNTIYVDATYNSKELNIKNFTTSDGFKLNGSGRVGSDYNTIEWEYTVDSGDGDSEKFKASYNRTE